MPFKVVRNDITKMHVDAIVNTASPMPGYGSGTDFAVFEAAGPRLIKARQKIGVINPGISFITDGYNLPAKNIIHTVGTSWQGGNNGEENVLRECYKGIFEIAIENRIESIAIPLLASGNYGFPKGIALRIALSEIEAFLSKNDMDVYLVVFDKKSVALSAELYGDIDEYINNNYVEEKQSFEYGLMHSNPFLSSNKFSAGFSMPELSSEMEDFIHENEKEKSQKEKPKKLKKSKRSLDDVINNLDKTFMEMVFSFADEKGISDVELQKKANIDRKAFSKLKCGTTKKPSKSTALALAIALELNLDETKDLLARAGLALSPCSKFDVIVQYFIEREAYDIYEINIVLFERGEQPLGSMVN